MPAERHMRQQAPGSISMLWIARPVGMCLIGMQLPGFGSTGSVELTSVSPAVTPFGAMM